MMLLAVDEENSDRIISTDKKAVKAGGLYLALDGVLVEYIVLAKRKGTTWYLAAMTNWQPRDLTLTLNMLSAGSHKATLFADGVNADRDATDYRKTQQTVSQGQQLTIHLAPGGGWSAIVE